MEVGGHLGGASGLSVLFGRTGGLVRVGLVHVLSLSLSPLSRSSSHSGSPSPSRFSLSPSFSVTLNPKTLKP